jgi:hypothetical protein
MGLLYAKEAAWQHGFNTANNRLIRVRDAANFGTFWRISRPHKLGSTYSLLQDLYRIKRI